MASAVNTSCSAAAGVIETEGVVLAPVPVTADTATALVKWIPDHSVTPMALAVGVPDPQVNVIESEVVWATVILQYAM